MLMTARVYVGTSVIGGFFDEEFQVPTARLFGDFRAKRFRPVLSIVTLLEIEGAPKAVQSLLLDEALRDHDFVDLNSEAEYLAEQHLRQGVIGPQGRSTMKNTKTFDAVKFMRDARDKLSTEMLNMTSEQRLDYIKEKGKKLKIGKELKK